MTPTPASPLRWVLVWLALFGVYAATLGIPAFGGTDFAGDEPHYLLTARSLVDDGTVDLLDEYRERAYAAWYPYDLEPRGRLTEGRLNEPHGIGFSALIAPALAIGGPVAVELLMAAFAALAFVLAMLLARRLVPEPWATMGPLVVALSPPALAYGTAVFPEFVAGAILAGAALLALSLREHRRPAPAIAAAALVGVLPWLGPKYLLPGVVIAVLTAVWLARDGRRVLALVVGEVVLFSLLVYVPVNNALYGGITPYAANVPGTSATGATFPGGYLERIPRLLSQWIDRDSGLLRWAPFLALGLFAVWLLWRSRRDRLRRVVEDQRRVEATAGLLVAVVAMQVIVAAFLAPSMYGFWFPGRPMLAALPALAALAAWGLRFAPRIGAVLAALTIGASAWLFVLERMGDEGWAFAPHQVPWGPLDVVFPLFSSGSVWTTAVSTAVIVALAVLVAHEWRERREIEGATRGAYSA